MKITFMHEGGIQEFTPPDFATSVVIKTRPNGVSIDYESSTVEAVKDFFDERMKEVTAPVIGLRTTPVKQPVLERPRDNAKRLLHRGKKGVGWKMTDKDRDAIVKAWTTEKPTPTYKALGARYGIHGSTVSDIIHQAMRNPVTIRPAKKKAIKQTKTWDRRALADGLRNQVLEMKDKFPPREIAEMIGISHTSVKRILNGQGVKGKKHSLTPFQEDEIMRLINEGAIARQAIADKFKVHVTTVNRVLAKKRKENFTKEMLDTTAG